MKIKIMYVVLVFSLITALICCNGYDKTVREIYKDRDITFKNCYSCHAPYDYLRAKSLSDIGNKFSDEELQSVLSSNFLNERKENVINEHSNIILKSAEINAVAKHLKTLKSRYKD